MLKKLLLKIVLANGNFRKNKLLDEGVLGDNRGIEKDYSQLSNEEIKKRNKELEGKNRRLEAELLLIKKLKLLEGEMI